jgi:hypothetical protein
MASLTRFSLEGIVDASSLQLIQSLAPHEAPPVFPDTVL